jgi:hypothetical protein
MTGPNVWAVESGRVESDEAGRWAAAGVSARLAPSEATRSERTGVDIDR